MCLFFCKKVVKKLLGGFFLLTLHAENFKKLSFMKKYLLTLFSVIVSITLMGQEEFTDTSLRLTYTVIDPNDHYVEVKKQLNEFNNNQIKVVNIPPTVTFNGQEYTVIKIANDGFRQSNSLQTITIPNTVTQIGNNAFQGCGMLEEVNMPNTISEIGSAAFQECHKLHSISLPNNLTTISEDLFHSCHNLNEIILPEGIDSISARAFQNTHDVKIIFLGCGDDANHEIIINSTAFQNCYNDDIEILCLEGVLNFKDQNGNSINFGNNTVFQVPCGMSTEYNTTYTNVTVTEENCVSISRKSGPFCLPETWMGYESWAQKADYEAVGPTYEAKEAWLKNDINNPNDDLYPTFVPREPEHPFYIQEGDTVVLNHSRHIYPFNSINKGVLVVNTQEGGQLIERDSLFFDEHYTLEVEYQINKVGDTVFITRNHHESTDITALLSDSHTTCGDYRYENGYIRDTETRYLLNITQSNGTYSIIVEDKDYYRVENQTIYYYRDLADVKFAAINSLNGTPNTDGFYKVTESGVTYIKHNITFNEETTTVTINESGNVTLHGTDYSYGHVKMHENLGGEIEIVVPATQGKWNFVGAPFKDYDLYAVKVGAGNRDVTIVEFDYANKQWSNIFSTVEDEIKAGEGFLAWPFYDGGIVFSTKRDMTEISKSKQTKILESDFALNNDDVVVEKTVGGTDVNGRWLALANPYPAKLCVNSFVDGNTPPLQGQGVYVLTNEVVDNKQKFEFKPRTDVEANKYDLGVGQGFFVNVVENSNPTTITFTKSQLHEYDESTCGHENDNNAKLSVKNKFVRLSMLASGIESELLFAHNEKAQQGYDIFDANKLFAIEEITEPYFVTDGIALVKEEVKDLPYYAKMNVRSFEDKEVVFRINNIPEDLVVFLIDNGKDIRMNGKTEYTTTITAGENADRFQLLVKKASSIEDVKDDNIEISNSNRFVSVSSTQTDLIIEVYNALGQKIMTTNNYNFNLNESSAGAYIVKAYNKAVSKTQKIVIK